MTHEPLPQITSQGRWIRFALVALPAGTIILGALSFVLYFHNKERDKERTYAHATALRREINAADLERHAAVIRDANSKPDEERRAIIASYAASTLSPENMGYDVFTDDWKEGDTARSNVTARLPGTKRPADVVLVVAAYGTDGTDASLASLLTVAQAMTGEPRIKTLHFAAIDASSGALDRLISAIRGKNSRVMQIIPLDKTSRLFAVEWSKQPGSGVVMPAHPTHDADAVSAATELKRLITEAADRL